MTEPTTGDNITRRIKRVDKMYKPEKPEEEEVKPKVEEVEEKPEETPQKLRGKKINNYGKTITIQIDAPAMYPRSR